MSTPQPTRAEIYERIKESSKQEVILEEMQRLGFWPKEQSEPEVAADLIKREGELHRELAELRKELAGREDPVKALVLMRKQRMKAALEKREQTKREHAQQRYDKALAWQAKRASHVGYLGPGVSAALNADESVDKSSSTEVERLAKHGLPVIDSAAELAERMGVTVPELRFLSFHREVARTHHYHSFTLPKKSGGERLISAPMPRLKRAQYWVLDNILEPVKVHDAAHGFLAGRSIISNAKPHAGRDVVINLDVKDFFPSIAFGRIKGVFRHLGYGERVATLLALLCSENRAQAWQVDGEKLFVGGKARERLLPQGAPTSPMLTNLLCRRMDRRLQGLAQQLGFAYTRYADDLTFSASGDAARDNVGRLLSRVRWILRDEGFTPHPDKERVMRKGRRQEVTGLVVNGEAPSVSRQTRRRLRAALHQASKPGEQASPAHWQGQVAQPSQLLGLAQFVHQVAPSQGRGLLQQAQQLMRDPLDRANDALLQAGRSDKAAKQTVAGNFRQLSAAGQAPQLADGRTWWQPAQPAAPVLEKTDQQRRDERREAQQETRRQAVASRAEANSASLPRRQPQPEAEQRNSDSTPDKPDAAPEGSATRRLATYWAQIIICFFVGNLFHNRLITLIAIAAVVVLYYKRKQRWDVFMGVLLVAVLLGYVVRS